ncbi:hypothetical protein ACJMK2_008082 [Sinanodonta woodiana]|uniref:RING finger protein 207 n=1 Tax=Sinanodonta woodiana TaxID=1069815 RepID=A0ABD3VN06_SINWO
MSGVLFPSQDHLDSPKWNPLLCSVCSVQYEDPCILPCFHSFCKRCLHGKYIDGKIQCPLCGHECQLKEGSTGPPSDSLLTFLVESNSSDSDKCSNCDKDDPQMYFCNTCSQPLCLACREDTHKAKMFSKHEITSLAKRKREVQCNCKVHGEPYILFSTEKKLMLCINCFRDMKVESRSHCVDLETAYKQGCQKLDHAMQSIRELQNSVRDSILLLRVLLEEIKMNGVKEKEAISSLYNTMQKIISEKKESLLMEVENQYAEKEKLFKEQLESLSTLLPTLHVHLVTCAAFSSSASRFEFLELAYLVMERLKAIIQIQHPLHPSQGSQIITDYKAQFAQCLEPVLFTHRNGPAIPISASLSSSNSSPRLDLPTTTIIHPTSSHPALSLVYTDAQVGSRKYSRNDTAKLKLVESTGMFADHCHEFDTVHRDLVQKVEKLKVNVQELQRDMTLRRCLSKITADTDITSMIKSIEEALDSHQMSLEQKQPVLGKHWEESLQRIAGEQEIYQAQLHDISRLMQETQTVKTIYKQLSSFASSLADVTKRLSPQLFRFQDYENQMQAVFDEINTVHPDSQHRVDAIRSAQEERDNKTANRTNPLDQELIKTKGMLRAPSARKESTPKESKEIKDTELTSDTKLSNADLSTVVKMDGFAVFDSILCNTESKLDSTDSAMASTKDVCTISDSKLCNTESKLNNTDSAVAAKNDVCTISDSKLKNTMSE